MQLIVGTKRFGVLETVDLPVHAQVNGRPIEGVILRKGDISELLELAHYGPDYVVDFLEKLYVNFKPEIPDGPQ